MPELPHITVYLSALDRFVGGDSIDGIDLKSTFLLRTFEPDLFSAVDKKVLGFQRLGKRIVWELEDDLFLVFHLMIAGRFHWKNHGTRPRTKSDLAAFHFNNGTLMLTEAGSKKRASLHVVSGRENLSAHQPGGLEILGCQLQDFHAALTSENHTLKRALTDPHLFSGIGNAYSDEIPHAACLSPVKWTSRMSDEEVERLFGAVQSIMREWIERLTNETGDDFPEKVTAFRPQMAAHGRFGKPCPECGTSIQRIRYAENETNYCPRCQTDGKVLADRSLSRLLKNDWPKSIDELEDRRS